MQVVVNDLQRVTRDKKTQKRWSLLLTRGLVVDIEPLDGLFRWLSWQPMIRWHADFIHASPHLCCQVLGPSLIKPSLNLVSRIKVRLLAFSSKRYPSQNRKCRAIRSRSVRWLLLIIRTTWSLLSCVWSSNAQTQMITFVWSLRTRWPSRWWPAEQMPQKNGRPALLCRGLRPPDGLLMSIESGISNRYYQCYMLWAWLLLCSYE